MQFCKLGVCLNFAPTHRRWCPTNNRSRLWNLCEKLCNAMQPGLIVDIDGGAFPGQHDSRFARRSAILGHLTCKSNELKTATDFAKFPLAPHHKIGTFLSGSLRTFLPGIPTKPLWIGQKVYFWPQVNRGGHQWLVKKPMHSYGIFWVAIVLHCANLIPVNKLRQTPDPHL